MGTSNFTIIKLMQSTPTLHPLAVQVVPVPRKAITKRPVDKSNPLPLRYHKASNQHYVLIDGKRCYLGRADAPDAQARYEQFLREYLARGKRAPVEATDILIAELLNEFRKHLDQTFLGRDGKPTKDHRHFKTVITAMLKLYGGEPAASFGPLKLRAVREELATGNRCRQYVNKLTGKIKSIFKWAVSEELVPVEVHQALMTVPGIQRCRSTLREGKKVRPVPVEHVEAIKPHVSRQVWALAQIQRLTAARGGELLIMRPVDIDTTADVWVYSPKEHKGTHLERDRKIYLGKQAQDILRPFLTRPVEAYCFSPMEAEAERREAMHEARVTPLCCGNKPGSNVQRKPKKAPGDRYTTDSYGRAIKYACKKAGIPAWHPHQLRHLGATIARQQFGLDAASALLGHSQLNITAHYAERNEKLALTVASQAG